MTGIDAGTGGENGGGTRGTSRHSSYGPLCCCPHSHLDKVSYPGSNLIEGLCPFHMSWHGPGNTILLTPRPVVDVYLRHQRRRHHPAQSELTSTLKVFVKHRVNPLILLGSLSLSSKTDQIDRDPEQGYHIGARSISGWFVETQGCVSLREYGLLATSMMRCASSTALAYDPRR